MSEYAVLLPDGEVANKERIDEALSLAKETSGAKVYHRGEQIYPMEYTTPKVELPLGRVTDSSTFDSFSQP